MRKRSAKERKKILLQCEYRLAVISFPNTGEPKNGTNMKSANGAENILPRDDNYSQKFSLPPRRKFAGSLKLQRFFLCGGGGNLFYFLFLFLCKLYTGFFIYFMLCCSVIISDSYPKNGKIIILFFAFQQLLLLFVLFIISFAILILLFRIFHHGFFRISCAQKFGEIWRGGVTDSRNVTQ